MPVQEFLLEVHERVQHSFTKLLEHCASLTEEELNHEIEGFGYPTVRLQLHHVIGAQKYWIGVLEGRIDADEDDPLYPTVASLQQYREQIDTLATHYLEHVSDDELVTARTMMTWGNHEKLLTPAHVFMRTCTHIYHHQGQVLAMCRLLGKPQSGLEYPLD